MNRNSKFHGFVVALSTMSLILSCSGGKNADPVPSEETISKSISPNTPSGINLLTKALTENDPNVFGHVKENEKVIQDMMNVSGMRETVKRLYDDIRSNGSSAGNHASRLSSHIEEPGAPPAPPAMPLASPNNAPQPPAGAACPGGCVYAVAFAAAFACAWASATACASCTNADGTNNTVCTTASSWACAWAFAYGFAFACFGGGGGPAPVGPLAPLIAMPN